MTITELNHVNMRTTELERLSRFYQDVFALTLGARPPFRFDGAWLYLGEKPVVHLVEVPRMPEAGEPSLEHFAFFGEGMAEFMAHLRSLGVPYTTAVIPELGNTQVNILDPDGNHVEIQFDAAEEADLSPFDGES